LFYLINYGNQGFLLESYSSKYYEGDLSWAKAIKVGKSLLSNMDDGFLGVMM
jgi:hypothetical protein